MTGNWFTRLVNVIKGNTPLDVPSPTIGVSSESSGDLNFDPYGKAEQARQNRIAFYKQVNRLLTDDKASRAVKIFADFISSPSDKEKVSIEVYDNDKAKQAIESLNERVNIKEYIWQFGYDLASFGDGFYEVVLGQDQKTVIGLSMLPPESMHKLLDEKGYFKDYANEAYVQKSVDTEKIIATFPGSQIIHVNAANRSSNPAFPIKQYGYTQSILFTALHRFIQHSQVDKAAYLSRLFFGMQRIVEYVDTGSMDAKEAKLFIKSLTEEFRQSVVTDGTGKVDLEVFFDKSFYQKVFIPRSEKLPKSEITTLDTRVTNAIADVIYFRDEYINALQAPKHLMGHTEDVATRANGLSFSADFAKSCARFQSCAAAALIPFYRTSLALQGIHYTNYKLSINFPLMGTVDNMMKYQIVNLQSQIMKLLAVDMALPLPLVLEMFLGFEKNQVDKITEIVGEYVPPSSGGGMSSPEVLPEMPPQGAESLMQNPEVLQILKRYRQELAELLEIRKEYETN